MNTVSNDFDFLYKFEYFHVCINRQCKYMYIQSVYQYPAMYPEIHSNLIFMWGKRNHLLSKIMQGLVHLVSKRWHHWNII